MMCTCPSAQFLKVDLNPMVVGSGSKPGRCRCQPGFYLWPSTHRNWLLGRGLPTGKELYSKMVDEADDMIMAMEEGREVDILQEVMRYSGLEAGEH